VLVFAVTRVIFIPQGEFVAFGALTLAHAAGRQGAGHGLVPADAGGGLARRDLVNGLRHRQPVAALQGRCAAHAGLAGGGVAAGDLGRAAGPAAAGAGGADAGAGHALRPLIYRLAYESLADASVLVLLIVSVGVHFALTGLGLYFFGAEGFRNPSFWDERFTLGPRGRSPGRR
jgi:branched-chain amino acid transport system permease protein